MKYCSAGCRKKGPQDPARIQALLMLLRGSPKGVLRLDSATEATLSCEREVLRACARHLVEDGHAKLYSKGRQVAASGARGNLELRRR